MVKNMTDEKYIKIIEKTFGKIAEAPIGKEIFIDALVYFVSDTRIKHDSGYPFIRIFGISGTKIYNLGSHDHFISEIPMNTDSIAKNIFRTWKWFVNTPKLRIKSKGWYSTFWIKKDGFCE
jgi:hypothetical protein